jgi:hypothetical protein
MLEQSSTYRAAAAAACSYSSRVYAAMAPAAILKRQFLQTIYLSLVCLRYSSIVLLLLNSGFNFF